MKFKLKWRPNKATRLSWPSLSFVSPEPALYGILKNRRLTSTRLAHAATLPPVAPFVFVLYEFCLAPQLLRLRHATRTLERNDIATRKTSQTNAARDRWTPAPPNSGKEPDTITDCSLWALLCIILLIPGDNTGIIIKGLISAAHSTRYCTHDHKFVAEGTCYRNTFI